MGASPPGFKSQPRRHLVLFIKPCRHPQEKYTTQKAKIIMKYPQDVLTISKRGKVEVRKLIDRGVYVRYEYIDPTTGEKSENKIKIVLRSKDGKLEEYFMIPLKQKDRYLLLKTDVKGDRFLWDGTKAVPLFEDSNE